jgi:hypothetical protein
MVLGVISGMRVLAWALVLLVHGLQVDIKTTNPKGDGHQRHGVGAFR